MDRIAEPMRDERANGIGTRVSRPLPTTRPLIETLRFNHFKNGGKFNHIAKRNLVQDLFRCISGYEDLWVDPDDPDTGKASFKAYDFHRVELEDDFFPHPRPFSVRDLQVRQDREYRKKHGPNGPSLERQRKGRKCGRIVSRLDSFYTCKTCFRDSSAMLCVQCFQHSNHEGHEVAFRTNYNFAPVCDCGALDLYKDPALHSCAEHVIADSSETPKEFDAAETDSPEVTEGFKEALYDTFVLCIEYIIETFQCAPPPDHYGKLPKDINDLKSTWGLTHTSLFDLARRAEGPWSVTIYADERHNEPELVRQMQHATGADYDDCSDWIRELDSVGRKVVMTSDSPTVAFFLANMFQQIDVPVSLRHAQDTYQECVASTMLEWLADICDSHVAGDPDLTTKIMIQVLREDKFENAYTHIAPDLRRMLRDKDHGRGQSASRMRLDWMWHIDSRFWKQPKLRTKFIYAKMMTVHPFGMQLIANRFAAHYVTLTQEYLHAERDQDSSLYQFFAYSISSDGKAIRQSCEHQGLLITIIDVLEAWYRHIPGDYRDAIPLSPTGPRDSDYRDNALRIIGLKNKKGAYILAHLRGLLSLDEVATWVGTTRDFVYRVHQFADLFIDMQPQNHETEHHINYEVDWYKSFGLMAELAKLVRQLGECYTKSPLYIIFDIMRVTANRITDDINLLSDTRDQARTWAPVWRDRSFDYPPETSYNLIEQQLHGIEGFSFHHYNHYLLAQMIESLALSLTHHELPMNFPDMLNMVLATHDDRFLEWFHQQKGPRPDPGDIMETTLLLIEQPLSKYIIARHIRADRWRRNGSSIRHQLNAYVDVSRREVTSDQEFYLLQAASLMLGPVKFVNVAMDRWGLMDEPPHNAHYMTRFLNPSATVTDLEDFIWFLIHLSVDTDRVVQTSTEERTAQEIVQLLAIKPMMFSEIAKRLSDRSTERVQIDRLVRHLADFRGPTETAPGIYTLKSQYIGEIDPLWRHYTRNERKEVFERLLKATFETRSDRSLEFDEWIYVPRKPELLPKPAPYWNLHDILGSPITIYVLQLVLDHCVLMEDDEPFHEEGLITSEIPRFDHLFDIALHYAMLALRSVPDAFIPNSISSDGVHLPVDQMPCPKRFSRQDTLYQNLWYMEVSDNAGYKQYLPRIRYLTRHIRETFSDEDRKLHDEISASRKAPVEEEVAPVVTDKATAAAARQKQVMAEFAKKQAAFAANMSFGADDEDGDLDDMDELDDSSNEAQGPCIVCQDPVTPARPGGMLALFQPSRVIRETLMEDAPFAEQSLHTPANLDCATRKLTYARNLADRSYNAQVLDSYPLTDLRLGCYISACGHYMHESCMEQYSEHTRARHSQQLQRNQPENVARCEYMCPLCKSISNFILPIDFEATRVGTKKSFRVNEEDGRLLTLLEHVRSMSAEGLKHINDSTKIWQHHTDGGHVKAWHSDFNLPRARKDLREADMRGTCLMVDKYKLLFRALADQSVGIRKKKLPWYAPEDAVGYTISVLEIAQRGIARAPGQATVAEQLLDVSRKVIKKMLEELKLELDGVYGKPYNHAGLRVAIFARFLPDWYRASSLPTSLLLRDPLSIVIECATIAPDVLHPVIIMAYYAELTRALIVVSIMIRNFRSFWKDWEVASDPFEYDVGPFAEQAKARFANFGPTAFGMFRNATPYNDVEYILKSIPDSLLSKMLYMYTLPFVRRAAIIFYSVHGCYPVQQLEDIITEGCEYDRLGSLLALPDPRVTLCDKSNGIEMPMVLRWLSQWAAGGRQVTAPEFPGIYELKFLPKHLDQLILRYGDDECMRCARPPAFPGLCLFCGELICIGGDCCAEDELGECNTHMQICGAATGIYLDVKRCSLVVLYAGTGSFLNAPYLDEHGDPDGGGQKRGHRLILSEQRYEEIRRYAWLNHSIPHLIARKLESVNDPGGWAAL